MPLARGEALSGRFDVDELRARPDLCDPFAVGRLLQRKPMRQGRAVLICCPWHAETFPSCSLRVGSAGTLAAKCFACGESGDVIALTMQALSCDFAAACEFLGAERPPSSPRRAPLPRPAPPPAPPAKTVGVDLRSAMFAAYLRECTFPVAVPMAGAAPVGAYLRSRGLSLKLAECFGVRALLTADAPGAARALDALAAVAPWPAWEAIGLARGARLLAHWAQPLVMAWEAPSGAVECLQFRSIEGPKAYRFTRESSPVLPFGYALAHAALARDPGLPLYVAEGALDAIALGTALAADRLRGAVVALPSASTLFGEAVWRPLVAGRVVALALDHDDAGDKAAARLAKTLAPLAASVERCTPPAPSKDWGEHVQSTQKATP